jgi:hypothetical protein
LIGDLKSIEQCGRWPRVDLFHHEMVFRLIQHIFFLEKLVATTTSNTRSYRPCSKKQRHRRTHPPALSGSPTDAFRSVQAQLNIAEHTLFYFYFMSGSRSGFACQTLQFFLRAVQSFFCPEDLEHVKHNQILLYDQFIYFSL